MLAAGAAADEVRQTPNTLKLPEGVAGAKASIKDAAWLAGRWEGTAFGSQAEEVWTTPRAGAMLGMFRLTKADSVSFYEIFAISEHAGSLILRLKHFNPDITGWEEKNEVRSFPLARLDKDSIWFSGMTYQRTGENTVTVFLAMRQKDGLVREERIEYRRVAGS